METSYFARLQPKWVSPGNGAADKTAKEVIGIPETATTRIPYIDYLPSCVEG